MPPALLGGAASAQNAGGSASSPRPDSTQGNDRRDFDALLKPGSEASRNDTPRNAGSSRDAGRNATPTTARQDKDAATRPATPGAKKADDKVATTDATATAPATAEKPAAEPADDTEAAWPPLGLAGLALNGLPVAAPTPVTPVTPVATGAAAGANAALPALATAAPDANATTPALAAAPSTDGSIALPALATDAAPADDAPLLKTFTDALNAATNDGPDAPASPLLHALQGMTEAKPTVASLFTGSPTATPHLGGEDFDDAVGARVGWLADQKIGHAHIKITPNDLGPIEVRLQLDGDKVHATFTSAHADVRHALESSLPRLRDLLGEQGFQLGNADVGHEQNAPDGGRGDGRGGMNGDDGEPALADTTLSPSQLIRQRGLVDAYA
ncbi:flagellar hook-length control protein FliK [Stenotrophomonas rhizophila]|uniref:Flagellar hook-length control protein FliK n=1 Tax=Stenotrophomonas rhizophila TaxID=216778 RepID=A0A7V8CHN8_9GAMM|nr:flagellar hook-length control protein FliK [Stenotrophomonas rhizophila]KAB7633223.1 flagellar hook-length control protein FliK [Stenotrophomonas rhizophila]